MCVEADTVFSILSTSLTSPDLTDSASLAGHAAQGVPYSVSPVPRWKASGHACLALMWVLEIWIPVLIVGQQVPYSASHLLVSSPLLSRTPRTAGHSSSITSLGSENKKKKSEEDFPPHQWAGRTTWSWYCLTNSGFGSQGNPGAHRAGKSSLEVSVIELGACSSAGSLQLCTGFLCWKTLCSLRVQNQFCDISISGPT